MINWISNLIKHQSWTIWLRDKITLVKCTYQAYHRTAMFLIRILLFNMSVNLSRFTVKSSVLFSDSSTLCSESSWLKEAFSNSTLSSLSSNSDLSASHLLILAAFLITLMASSSFLFTTSHRNDSSLILCEDNIKETFVEEILKIYSTLLKKENKNRKII